MNDTQERALPVLFTEKEHCCGCSACYAVCPKHAIVMKTDEEGFLYPDVIPEKCIRCYQCIHVCIFKADQKKKGFLN
ncbi:MAG: 4Fe-4S binding protein [Oscillospiraceae bacterium]|nr:4Fe-4S binding protein [Oscillospiraceae bacterium]